MLHSDIRVASLSSSHFFSLDLYLNLREHASLFFSPFPSLRGVFDSSLRIKGGSRFLIQEMCPSVDTRLPSARHLQLLIPNTASVPHPQISFSSALPQRGYNSQAPRRVFHTHGVSTLMCMRVYSQREVGNIIPPFWGYNQVHLLCA